MNITRMSLAALCLAPLLGAATAVAQPARPPGEQNSSNMGPPSGNRDGANNGVGTAGSINGNNGTASSTVNPGNSSVASPTPDNVGVRGQMENDPALGGGSQGGTTQK